VINCNHEICQRDITKGFGLKQDRSKVRPLNLNFCYTKPYLTYMYLPSLSYIISDLALLDISSMSINNQFIHINYSLNRFGSKDIHPYIPLYPAKICPISFDTYCAFEKDFAYYLQYLLFATHYPQLNITYDNIFIIIYCMVHEIGLL